MRDPYIHVEKIPMPGFGNAALRNLLTGTFGVGADLPKTVGTGCGKRRPLAMTSLAPEHVTCLPCRDYARTQHQEWAGIADAADDPSVIACAAREGRHPVTRAECEEHARRYRAIAARYT